MYPLLSVDKQTSQLFLHTYIYVLLHVDDPLFLDSYCEGASLGIIMDYSYLPTVDRVCTCAT
jgi:hypothetical protein